MGRLRYGLFCAVFFLVLAGCGRLTEKLQSSSSAAQAVVGVSMGDFTACYPQGSDIATCLSARNVLPAAWTQADFNGCLGPNLPTVLDSAMCLTGRGKTILHHRDPFQSDLEKCAGRVGLPGIAGCLNKNGVLPIAMSQASIDACVNANGRSTTNLEKCLRKNGFLTRKTLYQGDIALCDKIDGTGGIASCLINRDLASATLAQANVDACVANVGMPNVAKCLRNNRFALNALMQVHIATCAASVGQAGIATCLDNNGILEGGTQADIDSCIGAVGLGSVARCLRTRGLIPNQLLQAHLSTCDQAAGSAAVFNCLTANGLLINSPMVTQGEVDDCIARATAGGAVRCLVGKRLVTDFPVQAHFTACNRYGGQANLATCLSGSGVLLPGLTQAQVDQCIAAVGIGTVEICLKNNGFIQTYSALVATGGVFNSRCMVCHSAGQMRGMLNILSHASVLTKVVAGDPAASRMDQRINDAAMPMPPAGLIVQPERDRIRTWILQGARNN